MAWLGVGFDGVIVFDEAHAMANAAGGGKGGRGPKKASQQGMAGLALQNRLPNARILYVSATGATTPENLAYAARLGLWGGPDAPGDWTRVVRRFRDGHEEVWWAAEATLGPWGPDGRHRLVVATTDPATLPALSTWYLLTNLPRPGSPRAAESPLAPADVAEVVRLYSLRLWVEQSYK